MLSTWLMTEDSNPIFFSVREMRDKRALKRFDRNRKKLYRKFMKMILKRLDLKKKDLGLKWWERI